MPEPIYLRVAGIMDESAVDGPGLRMAVFAQGCPHHCPGCHNPETHDFGGGKLVDIEEITRNYSGNPLLSGLTCTGGEPFCQAVAFAALAEKIHELGGDIITYTGYTLEELQSEPVRSGAGVGDLLALTDYLVDGPFVLELASMELDFRGSSNQRFIDMRKISL